MLSLINPISTVEFLQKVQWVIDPVGYMESSAKEYPDIFTARIIGFDSSIVFVNEPQAIQQILTNDRKQFSAPGELNGILRPIVGDYSVFTLEGDRHKKRRQLVMPAFHGSRMQNYGQVIFDLTTKVLNSLTPQQPFIAREVMQDISLQIILQTVFGLYDGDRCQ